MSGASVHDLIRQVVSENPEAPARKLAHMVAERTDIDDLRDFYAAALEPMVADRIRLDRNAALNSKQGRSAKVERRRSWWASLLSQRVHVGDSTYKRLGECGIDELDYCITERRNQIGALIGQIAKYEALRDAVIAHGVGTVADLPEGSVEL